MVVTYNKTYRPAKEGNGWELFSDVSFKDSLIVWQLESVVLRNLHLSFDGMYLKLKEEYKTKTVRSRCVIDKNDDSIEVIVSGVFPRFYIKKKSSFK